MDGQLGSSGKVKKTVWFSLSKIQESLKQSLMFLTTCELSAQAILGQVQLQLQLCPSGSREPDSRDTAFLALKGLNT